MRNQKWKQIIVATVLVPLLGVGMAAPGLAKTRTVTEKQKGAVGELIVRYKDQVSSNPQALEARLGLRTIKRMGKTALLRVDESRLNEVARKLQNDPNVAFVEPNYVYTIAETTPAEEVPATNDPLLNKQWGLDAVNAKEAWGKLAAWPDRKEEQVVVAVVDTGVDASHPDLEGRVLPGFNTLDNSTNAADDHSHGTHVAGIIAATSDNGEGIAGVAGKENVKILPIKVLDENGMGTTLSIAAGVDKAVEMGADIINMSLGGPGRSKLLEEAIQHATAKGVLVVVAAGNEMDNAAGYWPAGYAEPVTVASVNDELQSSWFSNYGSPVDLAAPGEEVLSTVLEHDYEYFDGTSMAAPHVAAVAALVKLAHPDWSAQEIRAALENTAKDLDRPGFDAATGHGLVQADTALSYGQEQVLHIVTPETGSQVWGDVSISVRANRAGASQVDVYAEDGRKVAVIPLTQGKGSIQWDSTTVSDGKHMLKLQAVGPDGQTVGRDETLLLQVKNGTQAGVHLQIVDPTGEAAKSSVIQLLRVEDYEGDEYAESVMTVYSNERGQALIPYSALLPKESYYLTVQYMDMDSERMYMQVRRIDRQEKHLTVDLRDTVKLNLEVLAGGQDQPLQDVSFFFTPVLDGINIPSLTVSSAADRNGRVEVNLPPGEYVGRAVRQAQTGTAYYLKQTFTVDQNTDGIRFDLDQAKELTFQLPKWADLAVWGTYEYDFPAITLSKEGKLLLTADVLDDFWIDLMDIEGEFVKVYDLYRNETLELKDHNLIRLDKKPSVKVLRNDDEDHVYQPGDWVDMNYQIQYEDGIALLDVYVMPKAVWEFLGELGMHTTYKKDAKHHATKIYHDGKLVFDAEEEQPFEEDSVKVTLVNEDGVGVWSDQVWDWFRVPKEIDNGTYEIVADFTGLTFPVETSDSMTLREIQIHTDQSLSLEVLPPDEKDPIAYVDALVIDTDTKEVIAQDFSDSVLQFSGLKRGESYLFRLTGETVSGVPIYVERLLDVTEGSMKLDLSADQPVKLSVELDEGALLELEKNGSGVDGFLMGSGTKFVWMDSGTYTAIVTKAEGEEQYLYRTKLKVERKGKKQPVIKIHPDLSKLKKVTVESDKEDSTYEIGVRSTGTKDDDPYFTLFHLEPGDRLFLASDQYEFILLRSYETDDGIAEVELDVNPEKTRDGYVIRLDEEYHVELTADKHTYRTGDTVRVKLKVTDSQGNRVNGVQWITPDPFEDLSLPRRGAVEKNGQFTVYSYDPNKRQYDRLSTQEVTPEFTLLFGDKVIDRSRSIDNWYEYEAELPDDLEPGTYTLKFLLEGPFVLEQELDIDVSKR